MCGINGIFGLADREKSGSAIRLMNQALSHRGPDDEGVYEDEYISLGHRRLAIIDLSPAGHQPFFSFDKRYCIVYNGELYNFRELRFELQRIAKDSLHFAYPFSTQSDTEVILAAYMRWGKDCVKHFNGMFAFAVWDIQKQELFIARDRLGIKPLYYYSRNKMFLFSSELRALLRTGIVPRRADPEGLIDYLRYQTVHAPRTIIQGVGMLMPGQHVLVSEAGIKVEQYWDLPGITSSLPDLKEDYKKVCSNVHELLLKSVERRLIADVPFGAFLSGGIDSSIIVGLMSQLASGKVKTFSVSFEESAFSEAKYAQKIATKFQTEHHEIKLKITDFFKELPEALRAMDHPSGDGANTYVVSKATKNEGITMALSGLGGDELFAGYPVFTRTMELQRKQWITKFPRGLRKAAGKLYRLSKPGTSSDKMAEMIGLDSFDLVSTYPLSRQVMPDHEIRKLLKTAVLSPNLVRTRLSEFPVFPSDKMLTAVSLAETCTYMENTLLRDADQMSMAVALEVRVPFLDHSLVEYVLSLPDRVKYPYSPKKLLVDSVAGLLPEDIVNRPKMGFTLPWKEWMKTELRSFCEEKMQALSTRSSFNKEEIMNLWNAFLADSPRVTWSRVWYLVVLEYWLTEHQVEI
jgi:asparagine synthase (glutamine-hydrolysing)